MGSCHHTHHTDPDGTFAGHAPERAARTAAARARLLADAGGGLTSSLELPVLLQAIARLAVPVLADGCALDLIDEHDSPTRVALAHADPVREDLWWEIQRRYPAWRDGSPGAYPAVLREGRGVLVADVSEEALARIDAAEVLRADLWG